MSLSDCGHSHIFKEELKSAIEWVSVYVGGVCEYLTLPLQLCERNTGTNFILFYFFSFHCFIDYCELKILIKRQLKQWG